MPLSLFHISSKHSELREVPSVATSEKTVFVKSLFSLVSTGTERTVALGNVPELLYQTMAVPYMNGRFSFPIKYGYSLVGIVTEGDEKWIGKTVHLMHPHQDGGWVSPEDLTEIPHSIPPRRATLASNLETAVNAIWDGNIQMGDRVLLVGFGIIGALVAQLVSLMPGVEVVVLEKNKERQEIAETLGFQLFRCEDNFDVSIHASGSEAGLQSCINLVGKEGKIIELSWYGNKKVTINLGESFHHQRKQIISSQVSNIPSTRLARWDYKRRKQLVFELLQNPVFDHFLTDEIAFKDTPQFFNQLRSSPPDGIGFCIVY